MKYTLLIFPILLLACNSPITEESSEEVVDRYAHIADAQARAIVKTAIEHAGGMERWEAIKKLQYTKDFALLLESGEVEKSFKQQHNYQWYPTHIDIKSEENGTMVHTVFTNGTYTRLQDGNPVDMSQAALSKSVNTSTYVVSMPFKLLDPGPEIEYDGEATLSDGRIVDVLKVSYDADKHKNFTTSDIWRYYFDKTDRKIVANWVQTGDHFSLIENETFERVNGILFNKKRKSYRVDSLGNKLFVRADYDYDNYIVE